MGYPGEVLSDVDLEATPAPLIVDLGCDTGISTRRLSSNGWGVIGIDASVTMLRHASRRRAPIEHYPVARVPGLPLRSNFCDAATAFAAFHWFCDPRPVDEIARVVCPGGYVLVVQIYCTGPLRGVVTSVAGEFGADELRQRDLYDPCSSAQHRFKLLSDRRLRFNEMYTIAELAMLIKSFSVWSQIPSGQKSAALEMVFKRMSIDTSGDQFERPVEVCHITLRSENYEQKA